MGILGNTPPLNASYVDAPSHSDVRGRAMALLGLVAVCAYVAGVIVPVQRDVSLLLLSLVGLVTIVCGVRNPRPAPLRLLLPVVALVLSTLLSMLVSQDVERSWELSAPLVPGLLLFVIVTEYCDVRRHARALYATFSAVALVLAALASYAAVTHWGEAPAALVTRMDIPLLIVPNDCAFLALVAPLSIALSWRGRSRLVRIVARLSLVSSVVVVCLFHSRVAALALLTSVGGMALASRSRRGIGCAAAVIATALIADGVAGFPLLWKFRAVLDPRLTLWAGALAMARDAPILGHGPHTFGVLYRAYLADLPLPAWLPVDDRIVPWAHNLYLEVLAEQGLVGLAALIAMLAAGVTAGWRLRRSSCPDTRTAAAGALCGLLAFSVAAVLELSFVRQWVIIALFTFYGIVAQLSSTPAPNPEVSR